MFLVRMSILHAGLRDVALHFWPLFHVAVLPPPSLASDVQQQARPAEDRSPFVPPANDNFLCFEGPKRAAFCPDATPPSPCSAPPQTLRAAIIRRFKDFDSADTLGDVQTWRHLPLDAAELAFSPVAHLGACAF